MRIERAGMIFVVGMLISGLAVTGWAQATAQVAGTVKDQSGAVLPGVEVSMTQTETGLVRSTVTNETGSYVITNLPIGPYRLEAGLPGFRTYVQTGIVLQVNANPEDQRRHGSRTGCRDRSKFKRTRRWWKPAAPASVR